MQLKKRIHHSLLLITILVTVISVMLFSSIFYFEVRSQVKSEIKTKAHILYDSMFFIHDNVAYLKSLVSYNDIRITYIDSDGTVLFDNFVPSPQMDNHLDRPEIQEVIKNGFADYTRNSQTIGKQTYYYAIEMPEKTILRISQTTDTLSTVFFSLLPFMFCILCIIFIITNLFALRVTKKIIAPINDINFDLIEFDLYDELSPFIKKIHTQHMQITDQITDLEYRANTIKAITENMTEGLILLDDKSTILSINKSALSLFAQITGFQNNSEKSYIGRKIFELTRTHDIIESTKKVLTGVGSNIVCEFSAHMYNIFFSPTQELSSANRFGSIMLFVDITEKSRVEKMRREFSANVSHELKTPLTTICGYAEMLENGMVLPFDIHTVSQKIKNESQRLITLIEDIIRLSELDELPVKKEFEDIDVGAVTKEVIQSLSLLAQEKSVQIIDNSTEKIIHANKRMIRELLYNLIENAIKYNVQNGSVHITIYDENGKAHITVSDTGIGIASQYHDRIFERFYRIDKSRSKKTGGTGLGLSIVKHIAQYHSGTVSIESSEGKGTSIHVIL